MLSSWNFQTPLVSNKILSNAVAFQGIFKEKKTIIFQVIFMHYSELCIRE